MILLTSGVREKWYTLGIALCIPIATMEKFCEKYSENQIRALNRVYRFWLAKKNHLSPTWEKLISALQEINEYTVANNVQQYRNVSFDTEPNSFLC